MNDCWVILNKELASITNFNEEELLQKWISKTEKQRANGVRKFAESESEDDKESSLLTERLRLGEGD